MKHLTTPTKQDYLSLQARSHGNRSAFTLVEMLVSVALVLLMMLMFTEIFQILSGTMSVQQGLSENDQRARMMITLLQSDLDKRTFQNLIPISPTESSTPNKLTAFKGRRGYFSISENDPNNDTDDLIQFTVEANVTNKNGDKTPYYGRARELAVMPPSSPPEGILYHPNQPVADDAQIIQTGNPGYNGNGASESPAAEVCYFLRGGNLYRRVLLIRKPLDLKSIPSHQQPTLSNGSYFFDPNNPDYVYSGDFWNEYDFSAFYNNIPSPSFARFNTINSLDNTGEIENRFSLGHPHLRFGYSHSTGMPLEFVDGNKFIGRFTHEETSHPDFNYPQAGASVGNANPMNPVGSSLTLDNDFVVSQFRRGPRRSEDLVLSNVLSFDIKLLDEGAVVKDAFGVTVMDGSGNPIPRFPAFADIGGGNASDYRKTSFASGSTQYQSNNPFDNPVTFDSYGTNIYDTWHIGLDIRNVDMDNDRTTGGFDEPPFRPVDGSGNPRPLKAIQITLRYEDVPSGQIRQISIIHPLQNLTEE
jgi:type II secretory pathway pseudopilin PulG